MKTMRRDVNQPISKDLVKTSVHREAFEAWWIKAWPSLPAGNGSLKIVAEAAWFAGIDYGIDTYV